MKAGAAIRRPRWQIALLAVLTVPLGLLTRAGLPDQGRQEAIDGVSSILGDKSDEDEVTDEPEAPGEGRGIEQ
ncbi:MAG: hypothetical protein HGA65_07980 [Oscillochloris sp.]|nr:hypothetical protein [Oscillochloris sp.]